MRIEQLTDHSFETGAFPIAYLNRPLAEIALVAGLKLSREMDDLGEALSATLRLPSQQVVLLYEYSHEGTHSTVSCDTGTAVADKFHDLLEELTQTLGIMGLKAVPLNDDLQRIAAGDLLRRPSQKTSRQP